MSNVRQWYVYLVSAVTIQAVTWAVINLIRNLIVPGSSAPMLAIAFQVSVILVALPLFLVHWIWAQRRAASNGEERASIPRLLYLYAMMTAFLAPWINNAYQFIRALLHLVFDVAPRGFQAMSPERSVGYNLVPLVVLGLFWFYHRRVSVKDEQTVPASDASAVVRQLYVYLFTAIGLVMMALAAHGLLRWLLAELFPGGATSAVTGSLFVANEIARLGVGLALWLVSWRYAQRLFCGPAEQERQSLVRKTYLYLVIFATVLTVITTVTIVLSDMITRLMGVPSGGGDIRQAITILVVAGPIWAYHAYVLRRDADIAEGKEQQANVRRVYLYLTAGIGLAAVLAGLVGVLNALIQALSSDSGFILDLREQLGTFLAILLAGLPLWLINWSRIQKAVRQPDADGQAERRAVTRQIYLYFYLFLATMAILGSAIYILSQIVGLVLGARASTFLFRDMGQALAYMIIAAAVWLYHGAILRGETRLTKKEEAEKLRPLRVAVIDAGDGALGHALVEQIHQKLPSVQVLALGLSREAAAAMNGGAEQGPAEKVLAKAELIVGPWNMVVAGAAGGLVTDSIAHSIADSPAPKVIIPVRHSGWEWTGVESWKTDNIVKEATSAVKQMAIGEEVKTRRRLGVVSITLIVLVVLCLLSLLVPLLVGLFPMLTYM